MCCFGSRSSGFIHDYGIGWRFELKIQDGIQISGLPDVSPDCQQRIIQERIMRKQFVVGVIVFASIVVSTVIFSSGCGKSPIPAAAAEPSPSAVVPNVPVEPALHEDAPIITGPLIVEHQVDVSAQRDGVLAKIASDAGTRVKTGDVLAHMDDRQVSADLEAARARTRSIEADLKNWEAEAKVMQADYERAQKLWDAHVIPEEQLQHAKYKAESEQWDIIRVRELLTNSQETERSLSLELEKTRICAPFDGLVARRYVREGQQVAKGDRLFWVTAEAPLLMRFTLPEKFLGSLKKGQGLTVTSPDVAGEVHAARITELSPVVDPSSGTIEVQVELSGAQGQLRPGMTAVAHLENPPINVR
jgi:membrane fusion protein, multidrug efflux system